MRTTYYVVTGTALAVAALVVYAQLPDLNGPRPKAPPVAETAAVEPPRLPLPAVVPPPDEPLVMPAAAPTQSHVVPAGHTAPVEVPVVPLPPVPGATVPPPPLPSAAPPVPPPALPLPDATPAIGPPSVPAPPAVPPLPSASAVVEQPPMRSPAPYGPQVGDRPRTDGGTQPGLTSPPAPLPLPAPTPVPPAPAAGNAPAEQLPGTKFVVLKDDKLIEGAVALRGEWVFVRQGTFERSFPKAQVQFVGDSKDEVLKFMRAKVPGADATGRLQVARWCMFNGMREQALSEARAVQELQPTNADAAGLVRSLEQSLQRHPPGGGPRMTPPAAPTFTADLTTRPQAPVVEPEPDVTPEAAALFPTRVQPILANQCVDCHAAPTYAGKFKLAKVAPGEMAPAATRANLRAVAAQLRKDEPQFSPLLIKTLTAHGGQKAASAASRQAPAYQTLEAWTAVAVGGPTMPAPTPPVAAVPPPANPVVPPTAPVSAAVPPAPVVSAPALPAIPPPALPAIPPADPLLPAVPKPPVAGPTVPAVPAVPPIPPAAGGFGAGQPPKLPPTGPTGGDEFDPAAFNRGGK